MYSAESYSLNDEREDSKQSYKYSSKEIIKEPIKVELNASKTPVSISGGGFKYKSEEAETPNNEKNSSNDSDGTCNLL